MRFESSASRDQESPLEKFNPRSSSTTPSTRRIYKKDLPTMGYTLPCPLLCEGSLVSEVHHFRLMGHTHYERWVL